MADGDMDLTDELLGAYADNELDAPARERVEHALSLDRDARARLAAIRDVTLLVRAATRANVAVGDAAPPTLPLSPSPARRHRPRRGWLQWRIAAAFLAGIVAMTTTLRIVQLGAPEDLGWQRSALEFHDRYERSTAGRRTITLDHLEPASRDFANEFSDLVDFEPVIPDLSALDYRPVGARLLATPDGPATYVVYESPNRPIVGYSMLQSRLRQPGGRARATHNGIRIVSWSDGRFEYGLSSQLPDADLSALADTARNSVRSARGDDPSL